MPFCEYTDIVPSMISELEMVQLTDDKELGVVDMAVFTQKRDSVDALIQGFTRGKYPDGFTTTPPILFELAKEMTLYRIRKRRPNTVTEQMEKDELGRIEQLKLIQKGLINLGVAQTTMQAAASGSFKTNKTSADRMFPKSELDKY